MPLQILDPIMHNPHSVNLFLVFLSICNLVGGFRFAKPGKRRWGDRRALHPSMRGRRTTSACTLKRLNFFWWTSVWVAKAQPPGPGTQNWQALPIRMVMHALPSTSLRHPIHVPMELSLSGGLVTTDARWWLSLGFRSRDFAFRV
jgi:hypothetical protein